MFVIGVDDATRCPVIGSLVCAGVKVDESYLPCLRKIGIKDSKLLTSVQIKFYAKVVMRAVEKFKVIKIPATKISKSNFEYNMNDMECEAYCKIISELLDGEVKKIYVNNFDPSPEKFIQRAEKLGFRFDFSNWVIAHNNETRDLAVGCASILAKYYSLCEYNLLKAKYGDFGSGNPGDKKTIEFIKQKLIKGEKCDIIRYNWETVRRLQFELEDDRTHSKSGAFAGGK